MNTDNAIGSLPYSLRGEIDRIRKALERHNYNRTKAARELGISRTALYNKLRQYQLLDENESA